MIDKGILIIRKHLEWLLLPDNKMNKYFIIFFSTLMEKENIFNKKTKIMSDYIP
jgi:hypothetical protein